MEYMIFGGKKGNGKTRKMLDYMNKNGYHYVITDNPQALQVKINSLKYDIVAMTFEDFCNLSVRAPIFVKDVDKVLQKIFKGDFIGGTLVTEEENNE